MAGAVRLIRKRDGALVASELRVAEGFVGRARGLMGRGALQPGEGLLIRPCSSIHMMFMRFPIDAVFLRSEQVPGGHALEVVGEVVKVCARVRPWIGVAWSLGASCVVELEAGAAERAALREGDVLCVERASGFPVAAALMSLDGAEVTS